MKNIYNNKVYPCKNIKNNNNVVCIEIGGKGVMLY